MSRRRKQTKRDVAPDPVYKSKVVTKFMNSLMYQGKKTVAERILYSSFDLIKSKTNDDPIKVFNEAIKNTKPNLEVKSRRVGGATYQVPVDVRADRAQALAIRWLIDASRKRTDKSMQEKLVKELMDAAANKGAAIKKREDTHKMAEANKAFAHFRW
jgi:small subunit ribosomal protein S7